MKKDKVQINKMKEVLESMLTERRGNVLEVFVPTRRREESGEMVEKVRVKNS